MLKNFGTNWPAVWTKMGSSWVCVFIYMFTVCIPRCIPGQDFSAIPGDDDDEGEAGESLRGRPKPRGSKPTRDTFV